MNETTSVTTLDRDLIENLIFAGDPPAEAKWTHSTDDERDAILTILKSEQASLEKKFTFSSEARSSTMTHLQLRIPLTEWHIGIERSVIDMLKLAWIVYRLLDSEGGLTEGFTVVDIFNRLKKRVQKIDRKKGYFCIYQEIVMASASIERDLVDRYPASDLIFSGHCSRNGSELETLTAGKCRYLSAGACRLTRSQFEDIVLDLEERRILERKGEDGQIWIIF